MNLTPKEKVELANKGVLPVKLIGDAIDEAIRQVDEERTDEQLGLYSRWHGLNSAMLKYFRFNNVTMIAGMSGSGKSYILNMLEDDFTNKALNGNFKYPVAILAFKYEMDASDEVLRTVAGKSSTSYSYLLSAEWDSLQKTYNQIDDAEFEEVKHKFTELRNRPIYYVETAGNLSQLYNTVRWFKIKNPNVKLIITLDHTLLSQRLEENTDLELMSATALLMIKIRKETKAMVILLNQLNGEIEKPIRRENPALHHPVKGDIHCGNQVYWACDNVIIPHRPELLGITKYGIEKYNTKHLLHMKVIKSRKGKIGDIWLTENLKEGKIENIQDMINNNKKDLEF